jgi:glycosyltransferase involved in cell wall biosynthesis
MFSPPAPGRLLPIAVVTQGTAVWGAEQSILRLSARLPAAGIIPYLASPPGQLAEAWVDLGLRHLPLDLPGHKGLRREDGTRVGVGGVTQELVIGGRWAAGIVGAVRRSGAEMIYSQSLWAHFDAVLAGRICRVPTVLHVHDLVVPGIGRSLLSQAASRSALTIAISQAVASCIHADGRVRVAYQGVDVDRFRPGRRDPRVRAELGAGPDDLLVGVIGRIDPEKGIHHVVTALAAMARPRPRLAIIGAATRGPNRYISELTTAARTALGDDVRFVGTRTDVPDVLRALDVMVSAAASEPYGLAILEAMATGTPVVATAAGGAVELLEQGVTGILVPPGDPPALTSALERLAADRDLRMALAQRSRSSVLARGLTEPRYAETIASLLRSASKRPPRQVP